MKNTPYYATGIYLHKEFCCCPWTDKPGCSANSRMHTAGSLGTVQPSTALLHLLFPCWHYRALRLSGAFLNQQTTLLPISFGFREAQICWADYLPTLVGPAPFQHIPPDRLHHGRYCYWVSLPTTVKPIFKSTLPERITDEFALLWTPLGNDNLCTPPAANTRQPTIGEACADSQKAACSPQPPTARSRQAHTGRAGRYRGAGRRQAHCWHSAPGAWQWAAPSPRPTARSPLPPPPKLLEPIFSIKSKSLSPLSDDCTRIYRFRALRSPRHSCPARPTPASPSSSPAPHSRPQPCLHPPPAFPLPAPPLPGTSCRWFPMLRRPSPPSSAAIAVYLERSLGKGGWREEEPRPPPEPGREPRRCGAAPGGAGPGGTGLRSEPSCGCRAGAAPLCLTTEQSRAILLPSSPADQPWARNSCFSSLTCLIFH